MELIVEIINNPDNKYWIWKPKYCNKSTLSFIPSEICNVSSGQTVAVYSNENNERCQIAQLAVPDYTLLREYYENGDALNLNYAYIDDYSWLGDKVPYEIEADPYSVKTKFTADCSIWNCSRDSIYYNQDVHIMHSVIKGGDMSFMHTCFNNLLLDFDSLDIESGNIDFSYARLYDSTITLDCIKCAGNDLFPSELSFRYIKAVNATIAINFMTDKLSIDFLLADTINSEVSVSAIPASINFICLAKSKFDTFELSNADIEEIDASQIEITKIGFTRCKFLNTSAIRGTIEDISFEDSIITNAFEIDIKSNKRFYISDTLITGKLYIRHFAEIMNGSIKPLLNKGLINQEQLLVLKENFRQTGEYAFEDLCHLYYQRLITKKAKNPLKRICRRIIDLVSGYGTKPGRMLATIIILIALFGACYQFVPRLLFHGADTLVEHIYASGITFFAVGYGDLYPLNTMTKIVSLAEAFLGVVSTSYFLVLLSRKVIR